MKLSIWCDGSCRGNGTQNARGAWAYIICTEDGTIIHEDGRAVDNTTNQRMELMAALESCRIAELYLTSAFDEVHIYTDSAYLYNCVTARWYDKWQTNGWRTSKKEPVLNSDLWQNLIHFFDSAQFTFHKVKGHSDNQWNNYVDHKAQALSLQNKE